MTRARTPRRQVEDPLDRSCPACGAHKGQGCSNTGRNNKPLITRATRLVHADRLEGTTNA